MGWLQRFWGKRTSPPPRPSPSRPAPRPPAAASPGPAAGCSHAVPRGHESRPGTVAFEAFVAAQELAAGADLRHGAHHLANLLAIDPARPASLELLHRYQAAVADPAALLPPQGSEAYAATEALRAYFWHGQGRCDEALALLTQADTASPRSGYLAAWALEWLEGGDVESGDERTVLQALGTQLNRHPEANRSSRAVQRQLGRWADVAARGVARARTLPGIWSMVRIGLLRKAGRLDEALALAREGFAAEATWHTATTLGLVLRARGECDAADAAFKRAAGCDLTDASAFLEAADMHLDHGHWSEAEERYREALSRKAALPWAHASLLYVRWRQGLADDAIDRLAQLAEAGDGRAADLVQRARGAGGHADPQDATANILRDIAARRAADPAATPTGELRISVSSLEAPSSHLAVRLQFAAWGSNARLVIEQPVPDEPDPRASIEPVAHQLWRYDGTTAIPGLPPPPAAVTTGIAALAGAPWDDSTGWAAASALAERLGSDAGPALLAVMVHPPPVPAGGDALIWLPRVQLEAMRTIAHLDSGPWESSARRAALHAALLGPQDWTTCAAIRVLTRLAVAAEAIAPDVDAMFARLAAARPRQGHWAWEVELYQHWVLLPHLTAAEREALQARIDALLAPDDAA